MDFFWRHQPVQPCCKGMNIPYLPGQLPMIFLHLVIKLVIPCQRVFLTPSVTHIIKAYHNRVDQNIRCPRISNVLFRLLLHRR